jgi:hypothetical protein
MFFGRAFVFLSIGTAFGSVHLVPRKDIPSTIFHLSVYMSDINALIQNLFDTTDCLEHTLLNPTIARAAEIGKDFFAQRQILLDAAGSPDSHFNDGLDPSIRGSLR